MKYPDFTGEEPCVEVGGDMFFAADDDGRYYNIDKAKAVCGTCWMQPECAEYAINHDVAGVWGGLSEPQRRLIRKQRNIQPIPVRIGA